jgi:hypothetical protein
MYEQSEKEAIQVIMLSEFEKAIQAVGAGELEEWAKLYSEVNGLPEKAPLTTLFLFFVAGFNSGLTIINTMEEEKAEGQKTE